MKGRRAKTDATPQYLTTVCQSLPLSPLHSRRPTSPLHSIGNLRTAALVSDNSVFSSPPDPSPFSPSSVWMVPVRPIAQNPPLPLTHSLSSRVLLRPRLRFSLHLRSHPRQRQGWSLLHHPRRGLLHQAKLSPVFKRMSFPPPLTPSGLIPVHSDPPNKISQRAWRGPNHRFSSASIIRIFQSSPLALADP